MNFFRSEEHMKNWAQFNPMSESHIIKPLADWMDMFSEERFRVRPNPNYVSWRMEQNP
jgi:hypothetical protein